MKREKQPIHADSMKLAEEITAHLFTNGANQKARRLVIELEDGMNGGGWCREAVRDAIYARLEKAALPERGEKRG